MPEYKFGHFMKLLLMQLLVTTTLFGYFYSWAPWDSKGVPRGPRGSYGVPEYILNHNIKLLLMQL